MLAPRFSRFTTFLRPSIPFALGVVPAVAIPSWAGTPTKIASVAPEYTPTAGPAMPEPVSIQAYSFEVEPGTGRAQVVVDFTYPDQAAFGLDGGAGPEPITAQIPGLKYEAESRVVVYDTSGKKTVCATVRDRKILFWKILAVTPTGACVVTSRRDAPVEDTGRNVRRSPAIDTFFEVR